MSHLASRFRALTGFFILVVLTWPAAAQQIEKRIALVIGNAAYASGELPTTANDAGLIAQQLQAAGFDVSGARDLDGETLRRAFRDFVDKAAQSGPDAFAVIYFAGYGLQSEGENYVVPIDAHIPRAADVPIQAVRISDLMRPLAELPLKGRIVVLDAARENPFAREGQPLASGLALVEPDPGTLIAFNAAPGTVAPPETGNAYSPYARALAEMIREGGIPLRDVFDQVRLRVSDITQGAVVPWDADRIEAPFLFFDRKPDAPPPPSAALSTLRDRPIRDLGAGEAYQAALDRDTVPAYQEFLEAYPSDPLAKRVRALLAARREALTWRRTLLVGTADAYWSYMRRYPRGPHLADCHRRLAQLAVDLEPPPTFEEIEYDLPPPPPEEIVIVDRPVLTFADPYFDLPPPPPVIILAPPPVYIVDLPPPPPPVDFFVLPVPVYEPLPIWVDWPVYVAPPPVNIISYNIHNTVIVNPAENTVIVKDPEGQPVPPFAHAVAAGVLPRDAAPFFPGANGEGPHRELHPEPGAARLEPGVGAVIGAGALGAGAAAAITRAALPPLPPSVAARVEQERRPEHGAPGGPPPGVLGPGGRPLAPGQQAVRPLPGQALPGQQFPQPLPGQSAPLQGQGRPLQEQGGRLQSGALPGFPPGVPPGHALPGQPMPGQPLPGQAQPGRLPGLPGQPSAPSGAPANRQIQPAQIQPGQNRPLAPIAPGLPRPGTQEQQLQQQRALQTQQQRDQQAQQQREQQMQQQRDQQAQQQREQQMQQQRAQQAQQQREQQMQQQRAQQAQQQREQQMQQQRDQQAQQQREQQVQQQRAQQAQQQREQQMQQQRAQQAQQQREQQMQQQRAQQAQQQREQQMQQVQQMRAQQMQQMRAQQMQQQGQQRQQQMMQQRQAPGPASTCGRPGQPPCR